MAPKNFLKASSPPAEAPMPTIGNTVRSGATSFAAIARRPAARGRWGRFRFAGLAELPLPRLTDALILFRAFAVKPYTRTRGRVDRGSISRDDEDGRRYRGRPRRDVVLLASKIPDAQDERNLTDLIG